MIEGWVVYVSRKLLADDRRATEMALDLLGGQLEEINRVVPQSAVAKLQKVPLWISPEYPGVRPQAEYHPGAQWLRDNGRDPAMVKGVEFTNVRIFESEARRMPMMALHELAHAYHHQVLDNDHPEIRALYDKAKSSGKYDRVERRFADGKTRIERAYALSNPQEYFAESTEAYFGKNDYFPFTKTELEKHDPEMAVLLGRLWGHSPTGPAESPIRASESDKTLLTLDRIFASEEFLEERPGAVIWSKLAPVYFRWESAKTDGARELLRCDPASNSVKVLITPKDLTPQGKQIPLPVDGIQFSADESKVLIFTNSQRVWRQHTRGDYWCLDLATHELKKLGGEAALGTLMFCKFSPDGTRVAYVLKNNIYVQELAGMHITPVTTDGSAKLINGTSDWVNEEELDIRDGFRWSPDGRSIAFWQFDLSGVREFYLLDTETTYSRPIPIPYPIAGEQNSATRLGVVSTTGGAVRWLDIPGDPRNHYLPKMEWAPDGSKLLVQQFNRLQTKNRVLLADQGTGKTHEVFTETDVAWLENVNPVRWARQGAGFVWLSERDGWNHAFLASCDGKSITQITRGAFDVIDIEAVDDKNGWLYYAASPDNPTQRYLFRSRMDGSSTERLSPADQPGWHTYDISPDACWAIHTYSTFTTPPLVELIRLHKHEATQVLVDNRALREKLAGLRLPRSEFFRVDIGDQVFLDAWSLKPQDFDASKKYPLFIYVYGEPHAPTVRDEWQGQHGLWHLMLAQRGYLVASVDNRGTMVPRGRAWRKVVHRQIGILASDEQAKAAAALLKRWPFADPARVGIWGWSGGGSMSLQAIFRFPDLYRTAIAVAPVANQHLYDTIYQERYMGLPGDNPEGYRRGSPLTYAGQLKGDLLLVHGTGDDNCHYLGTEMLMNELIAHNKQFTVMPYPNRTHSISEGKDTTRHLFGLLTRHLEKTLPLDPR